MIPRRIVRRYAAALFGAASKGGVTDAVEDDLGLISHAFETSPELWDAVRSPVVDPQKKNELLADLFEHKVQRVTLDYLSLLVEKHREDAIEATQQEYVALANEVRGIVEAEVTTATPMLSEQETLLENRLSKMIGKQVRLRTTVEPGIVGGVIVRVGDRVIDGSIRGRLAALREELGK